jgi:hypothetical protein
MRPIKRNAIHRNPVERREISVSSNVFGQYAASGLLDGYFVYWCLPRVLEYGTKGFLNAYHGLKCSATNYRMRKAGISVCTSKIGKESVFRSQSKTAEPEKYHVDLKRIKRFLGIFSFLQRNGSFTHAII